jgi:hypothetical protein
MFQNIVNVINGTHILLLEKPNIEISHCINYKLLQLQKYI